MARRKNILSFITLYPVIAIIGGGLVVATLLYLLLPGIGSNLKTQVSGGNTAYVPATFQCKCGCNTSTLVLCPVPELDIDCSDYDYDFAVDEAACTALEGSSCRGYADQGTYYGALNCSWAAVATPTPTPVTNKAPVISSIYADDHGAVGIPGELTATVNDDGLPNPPNKVTTRWIFVSGPGTVSFANQYALATTFTASKAGDYKIRLAANDSVLYSTKEVEAKVKNK